MKELLYSFKNIGLCYHKRTVLPWQQRKFWAVHDVSFDVYRGETKPVNNLIDFGFYVSFFPQLVAGPIVRASGFVKQIYEDYHVSKVEFGWAIFMILKGLIKKIFIGDYIAVNFVDRAFSDPVYKKVRILKICK